MSKALVYHIKVKLRSGETCEGFVTPPFWVAEGETKTLYPAKESGKLAIIHKEHWPQVAHSFQVKDITLTALPEGYMEFSPEEIGGVEVIV